MKRKYIAINEINKITEFVRKATEVKEDILCTRGRYTIDGKSLLGVLSIDMSNGAIIEYPEDAIEFEKYITQFEVNKVED